MNLRYSHTKNRKPLAKLAAVILWKSGY